MLATDLSAEYDHVTNRGSSWQVGAEKAVASLKARRQLCLGETQRRKVAAETERKEAGRASHHEMLRLADERRAAKSRDAMFVKVARRVLPKDTITEIWNLVTTALKAEQGDLMP